MSFNKEAFKRYINYRVFNLKSQEEYDSFLKIVWKLGYRFSCFDKEIPNYWKCEDFCIRLKDNRLTSINDKEYYIKKKYTIYDYSKFKEIVLTYKSL